MPTPTSWHASLLETSKLALHPFLLPTPLPACTSTETWTCLRRYGGWPSSDAWRNMRPLQFPIPSTFFSGLVGAASYLPSVATAWLITALYAMKRQTPCPPILPCFSLFYLSIS